MLNALCLAPLLRPVQAVAVPPEVVGRWRSSSGDPALLAAPGAGPGAPQGRATSRLLTLRADGTYRQESSTAMVHAGHRMRVSCAVEGRFEARDGRIRLAVERGRQSGEDNLIESGNYDRPLPPDLVKRMSELWSYRTGEEGGRSTLTLLSTETPTDGVTFARYRPQG